MGPVHHLQGLNDNRAGSPRHQRPFFYRVETIRKSGRRLVIEDLHYLSHAERTTLAFDLKAFWDYKTYVVVVGVWSGQNILTQAT